MATRLVPQQHVQSLGPAQPDAGEFGGGGFSQKHLLYTYAHKFWRYKWIMLTAMLVGLIYGAHEALSTTPQYRATLTMLIDPEDTISETRAGTANFYTWKSTATQGALIQSRSVAEDVVDNLDLVNRNPLLNIPEREYQIAPLRWLQTTLASLDPSAANEPRAPPQSAATPGRNKDGLAEMVRSGLSVKGDKETELIFLGFSSSDPEFAAEIVNAVAGTFIAKRERVQLERARRTTQMLTEQLPQLKGELRSSIKALQDYRLRESVGDSSHLIDLSNTRIQSLTSEATTKRLRLEELSKSYGPKHPKIIAAKAQFRDTERYLAKESEKTRGSRQKEFRLAELEQDVETNRELYDTFLSQLRELDISANQAIKDARIIDPAKVPQSAYAPNESQIIGKRVLLGAVWGIGIILLIVFLDNTFRDSEQIEELLGIPCFGTLPLLTKSDLKPAGAGRKGSTRLKPEFYVYTHRKSVFAESINHIRTGVIYSDPDNPPQVLVVSSALESEGKTTLATNLAIAFSRFGETLLVDADLRNPGLQKLTNLRHMPGLVELIIGKSTPDKCISGSKGIENLSLLGHGMIPPNPMELLSSGRFKQVLSDLKKIYRYIIIDTPPILPVSDAIVLAHAAGGLILTIEANRTKQWTARMAVKRLIKANIRPLGLVLSKADTRKSNYPYYYGYYSSYYTKGSAKDNAYPRSS